MYLKDLFEDVIPQDRYNAKDDDTVLKEKNTRKIRLTLTQISRMRRMSEVRKVEQKKQWDFFKQIYGASPAEPSGMQGL